MKFFKPEDFAGQFNKVWLSTLEIAHCAELANAKLEREAKVVYGHEDKEKDNLWFTTNNGFSEDNLKALLIAIEPIEKISKREKAIELITKWLKEPGNYDEQIMDLLNKEMK